MSENITGVPELSAAFKSLGTGMETRTARLMVVSGGRIIRDEAKRIIRANGSVKTKAMINNVVVKRDKAAPKGEEWLNVGVRHGRHLTKKQKANSTLKVKGGRVIKSYANDPWYYFLIEHTGAKPHNLARGANASSKKQRKKVGHKMHPGFQKKPFLKPALEGKQQAAIDAMTAKLNAELVKAQK